MRGDKTRKEQGQTQREAEILRIESELVRERERERGGERELEGERYQPKQRSTNLPSNWAPSMGYPQSPSTIQTALGTQSLSTQRMDMGHGGVGREGGRDSGRESAGGRVRRSGDGVDIEEDEGDVGETEIVRGTENIVWIDGAPYADLGSSNSTSTGTTSTSIRLGNITSYLNMTC